jgi:hypothetical protein
VSPKLLLAAGSAAASLAGVVPSVTHGPATEPLHSGAAGVAVTAGSLRVGAPTSVRVDVPVGVSQLTGSSSGSPALAGRVHVIVLRAADGAILFTGSLATFRTLPVRPGTTLVVRVQRAPGYAGLRAGGMLRWS